MSPFLLRAALLCMPVVAGLTTGHTLAAEEAELALGPALESPSRDYQRSITRLESSQGAYAAQLPESLLSLGIALQRGGKHQEAVDALKRGVHLARINDGLYSIRQIPMLQREIASHLALGQYAEADERQAYLYRVQMRSQEPGTERAQAFIQQAQWQFTAHQLDLDNQSYARIMSMWDLYRLALNDIIEQEGPSSPLLLEPLEGMLLAQYLIADYDTSSSGYSGNAESFSMQQQQNRFNAYRAQSYKRGQAVIQAIYDIRKAEYGDHSRETAESKVLLGDWMLWHGERSAAFRAYREAVMELTPRDDAEDVLASFFDEPVELPTFAGVSKLPPAVDSDQANLMLQFGVNARGRVVDLERVDDGEVDDALANRVMRTLRRTQFRPKLALGEPQETQTVFRAYEIQ